MSATMKRKKREAPEKVEDLRPEQPGKRSAYAGECVMCIALLKQAGRKQNTKVTKTVTIGQTETRYCECRNCGHTWKRTDPVS